jgi:uncharacterized protein (TIGR02001 family)
VLLLALGTEAARAVDLGSNLTLGGNLALTSDYIYRGLSESGGSAAVQGDLHLASTSGNFIGMWGSTRDHNLDPYATFALQPYLGHRFNLGSDWAASIGGRAYLLLGGDQEISDDYEELTASVTYQDRWSLSVSAIPNAVRYWFNRRLGRTPAYVADTTGQWFLGAGFFLTAGLGYYYSTGTGPGIERATGYAYGNAGVAFEYRQWRLDVGYFVVQDAARRLFPYPLANDTVAASVVWRF